MTFDVSSRRLALIAFAIMAVLASLSLWFGSSRAQLTTPRPIGIFGPDLPHSYSWSPYMRWLDSVYQLQYAAVPIGLNQATAWGESNFDTTATRFEPKYKSRYGKTIRAHAVTWCKKHKGVRSIETEFDQRCYSYNMHQNMGENLREAGYNEPTIAAILFDTRSDIAMFYETMNKSIAHYKALHKVHHTTREVFLEAVSAYNGGPGACYPYQPRGHFRNWDYVKDKEMRMITIAGIPNWGKF
jgi:hypothetical protein